jgi:probable F420-dependent oxidoreductase
MQVNISLPFERAEFGAEFVSAEAVVEIAQHVERLGFSGGNVTDHPCPTARWRDAGGHDAHDPLVLLSFVAAATTRLRLQTSILVLPYRNPFITAKAAASLDIFSGGRLTLGMGAGYMKGEYYALGVDFERRNELMDEYILAMKAAWSGETFDFEGSGYSARGVRMRPTPAQKPYPPLYVGGNSRRAIRRAVELADGWNPFFTGASGMNKTSRTKSISDASDIAEGIAYLEQYSQECGREQPPKVFLSSVPSTGSAQEVVDALGYYQSLGVVGATASVPGETRAQWCDNAEQFAVDVLNKLS